MNEAPNDHGVRFDARSTITSTVLRIAKENPKRQFTTYVRDAGETTLTYGTLVDRACRAASVISAQCEGRGNVVIIMLPHGPDLPVAFLGAIFAGQLPSLFPTNASKVPLATLRDALDHALAEASATALITDAATTRGFFEDHDCAVPWSTPADWETAQAMDPDLPSTDSVAFLQHSSGTTGHKKGVAITHRALLTQITHYGERIDLRTTDLIASWLPLYHDMGLIACFLLPLLTKTPVVSVSPFDWVKSPVMWLRAISRHRATLSWMPNFAFHLMAQRVSDESLRGVSLDSLRAVINCAEPITMEAHRAFFERFESAGLQPSAVSTCYAMAENTFAVTQSSPGQPPRTLRGDLRAFRDRGCLLPARENESARTWVSSGEPLDGVELRISSDQGRLLPEGHVGEITFRTDSMLGEYHRRPDLTQEALRDGWYASGDLGFMSEGSLFVTGRKNDLIIVAGKNIYPDDVEAIVTQCAGTKAGRSVAFGIFDPQKGTQELVVLAEVEPAPDLDPRELRRDVLREVASKLECSIDHLRLLAPGTLRKSTSGKISRPLCKDLYQEGELVEWTPPRRAPQERGSAGGGTAIKHVYAQAALLELLIHGTSLLLPGLILSHAPSNPILLAMALLGAFYAYVLGLMVLVAALMRALPKPRRGPLRETADWHRWARLSSLLVFARRTPVRWYAWAVPPGNLFFRWCGAKIHKTALLTGFDQIAEPWLVEVGEGTILGRDATLTCHFTPQVGSMVVGRIRIGKNVLIGRSVQLWPNVIIEDDAVIQERSSVMPGTIVPAGEIWGGVPARPIMSRGRAEPARRSVRSSSRAPAPTADATQADQVQAYVIEKLRCRAGAEDLEFNGATAIAETGVLDSMSFLGLLGDIETNFGLQIDADMLDYRTLTIADVARMTVAP